jgi:hypothetical protein
MVLRGVLEPHHRPIAETIFNEDDFATFVLRAHLLLEKGLNARLSERGIPNILLGEGGLTFYQKYRAYRELYVGDGSGKTVFDIFNTLRNNIAHDFWEPDECVRRSFRRAYDGKRHKAFVESNASAPLESVKTLYFFLAVVLGIYVADRGLPWDPELETLR